jgi:hypothetical protein
MSALVQANLHCVHAALTISKAVCALIKFGSGSSSLRFPSSLLSHLHDQYTTYWCLPFTSAAPPTLLTWPRRGITAVILLTGMGRLLLLHFQNNHVISLHFLRNNSVGRSVLLYIPRTSLHLHNFLRNDHTRNIVGQDLEFWITDIGKQRFEEQCIQSNYTLFIWVMYQKTRMILVGKRCIGEWWIEVQFTESISVHCI